MSNTLTQQGIHVVKRRRTILILAFVVGILTICGSALFAIAGAGIYGSPFAGDTYFDITLLMVLLFGPVAILPCTILDYWKQGCGGAILCGLSIIEAVLIILNNIRQWGFAIHDAALGSFLLALPMFAIGTLLIFSSSSHRRGLNWIWRVEVLFAVVVGAYFSWHVGADGASALFHLLRGGII